jgi:hypothetical protein
LLALRTTGTVAIPAVDLGSAASLDVFQIIAVGRERWPFRTHPSMQRRLEQLERIGPRLQQSGRG